MKHLFAILIVVLAFASLVLAQNTATVTETGDNNAAFIEQVGSPNTATISQTGDKNNAAQSDLYASSLFGLLTGTKGITQHGAGNNGTITQTLTAGAVSAGPIAGIGQYSDGNTATITQSSASAWAQGYAWVRQDGASNTSVQNQGIISYQFSHILQAGNSNYAETQQPLDGYGQKANILQTGNHNNAFQYQGKVGYTEGNLAEATQSGSDNHSNQYQYGSSNTARAIQSSDLNVSYLVQNGNTNNARIEQKTGTVNTVNLTQDGGAEANILQDGASNTVMGLGALGMANSLNGSNLDVDQIGTSNTLHVNQTSLDAHATVMQNGTSNVATVDQH